VICIVGAPRSGTHLVNSVLCASDEVLPMLSETVPAAFLLEAYEATRTHIRRFPGIHFESSEEARTLYGRTLREFVDHLCRRYDREVCVFRSPRLSLSVPTLRELADDAEIDLRVICMVRDPRDVAASMRVWSARQQARGMPPLSPDGRVPIGTTADELWDLGQWYLKNYRSILGPALDGEPDDQLCVRYEDLVQRPAPTIRALGRFCGLSLHGSASGRGWKTAQIPFSPEEPRVGLAVTELFGAAISDSSVGAWTRELSDSDGRRVLWIARQMVERFYADEVAGLTARDAVEQLSPAPGLDAAALERARAVVRRDYGRGPEASPIPALLEAAPRSRVLQLGCGAGSVTLPLAARGHRMDARDPSRENVAVARAAATAAGLDATARFEAGALDALADLEPGYQVVLADRTLHDADPETVVREARRLLVPDGRLIAIVYGPGSYLEVIGSAIESGDLSRAVYRLTSLLRSSLYEAGLGGERSSRPRLPGRKGLASLLGAYGFSVSIEPLASWQGLASRLLVIATRRPAADPGSCASAAELEALLRAGAPRLVLERLGHCTVSPARGAGLRLAAQIKAGAVGAGEFDNDDIGGLRAPGGVPIAALLAYERGEFDRAAAELRPASSRSATAALLRGAALLAAGDHDGAEAFLGQALERHGDLLALWVARLAAASRDPSRARSAWRQFMSRIGSISQGSADL
jgi:2-polyprenyl-3-methyl-5-hydroxy-6-metoxy-1,4-benzoquinol methylase